MATLFYKQLPTGYTHDEDVIAFGIELSGIQKFIFNVTENKGSLRQIKENSLRIEGLTKDIYNTVSKVYTIKDDAILTMTSGKLYFIAKKDSDVSTINRLLHNLQRDVFLSFGGVLRLYYAHVKTTLSKELRSDTNAYKTLKDTLAKSRRQNYALLNIDGATSFTNLNHNVDIRSATTIDKLIGPNQNHRYISGIKLDFDDLGAYFASIGYSDEILRISALIEKRVRSVIDEMDGIYTVFVGGDDIFILSNFYKFMDITLALKNGLQEAFNDLEYSFGVSAGIVHFKEKTSIVYYGEQLENELSLAKEQGKNRVAMENVCFTWEDFEKIKSERESIEKRHHQSVSKSSQLAKFENTIQTIVQRDDSLQKKVRAFILKIPMFEERLKGFVPKSMLSLDTNQIESYYRSMIRLYFATKYARRLMERET